MKNFLLFVLFFPVILLAQNAIPNSDFENWTTGGIPIFGTFEDPNGWNTINSTTYLVGIQTVTKASHPQFVKSGNFALRLETYFFAPLNRPAQGGATTADIDIANESLSGGVPFNLRPSALEGWYQYYPVGVDTATMAILLSKWNFALGVKDTVGYALLRTADPVSVYTQFSAELEYFLEDDPDTMIVGFVCSGQFEPGIGSVMYLDDVSLVFEPVSVTKSASKKPLLYPNPTRELVRFDVPEAVWVTVRSLTGQIVLEQNLLNNNNQISLTTLNEGLYLLQFIDSSGKQIVTSKISLLR
jgi:hypothetical protein